MDPHSCCLFLQVVGVVNEIRFCIQILQKQGQNSARMNEAQDGLTAADQKLAELHKVNYLEHVDFMEYKEKQII